VHFEAEAELRDRSVDVVSCLGLAQESTPSRGLPLDIAESVTEL
jgi:hypothetical protein